MTEIEIICRWLCEQKGEKPDDTRMIPLSSPGYSPTMRTGKERVANWEVYRDAAEELLRRLTPASA